jgi:hypothetical protein
MAPVFHNFISGILSRFGLRLNRLYPPMHPNRTLGDRRSFLADIHARGFECRGVIDVGANRGAFTHEAISVFPHANFLLIEPQSEMVPYLEALRKSARNVEYVVAGAGSKEGELVLTISGGKTASTFLFNADDTLIGLLRIDGRRIGSTMNQPDHDTTIRQDPS